MDHELISLIVEELRENRDGWEVELRGVEFFGQPVSLVLQTMPIPRPEILPPSEEMKSLVFLVLGSIEGVLTLARSHFEEYHAEGLSVATGSVAHPHIWIYQDNLEEDGPGRWTFVVESNMNPDYGTHIEFDGLTVVDVWGGD
ncbi:hypothetical protein C0431_05595 [bacterium]|nr:hypothetical protein [bacterium]